MQRYQALMDGGPSSRDVRTRCSDRAGSKMVYHQILLPKQEEHRTSYPIPCCKPKIPPEQIYIALHSRYNKRRHNSTMPNLKRGQQSPNQARGIRANTECHKKDFQERVNHKRRTINHKAVKSCGPPWLCVNRRNGFGLNLDSNAPR